MCFDIKFFVFRLCHKIFCVIIFGKNSITRNTGMHPAYIENKKQTSTPIFPVTSGHLDPWISKQPAHVQQWLKITQFTVDSGTFCLIPNHDGSLYGVLLGLTATDDYWAFGALPPKLPAGKYHIEDNCILQTQAHRFQAALGWGFGFYQFTAYKKAKPYLAKLVLPGSVDAIWLSTCLESICLS